MAVRPQFFDASTHPEAIVLVVTMSGERYELGRLDANSGGLLFENLATTKLRLFTDSR